jgi:hypothetical protein
MAQEIHSDAHPAHEGHIENVCLTGTVVMTAFCVGLAITGILFWWALFAHH